tara:strand:+ start:881 stop:1501 length:621 start_codon:yes stop_codon:yes gene_type:complete
LEIKSILILAIVCVSGAISPGPSLAVVIRNTIRGGRPQGIMTGLGHGLGITIYAFIAVAGLSSIFTRNQTLFVCVQIAGSLWLMWIGCKMILSFSKISSNVHKTSGRMAFGEGFMISFLNPKILVFFVAVFSQFIHKGLTIIDKTIIIMIAAVIDTSWYILVATLLAGTKWVHQLKKNSLWIDRLTGVLLIGASFFIIMRIVCFNN